MKYLYSILFLADAIIMVLLSYFLLEMLDAGSGKLSIFADISGIIISIGILFLIVAHFLKSKIRNDQ